MRRPAICGITRRHMAVVAGSISNPTADTPDDLVCLRNRPLDFLPCFFVKIVGPHQRHSRLIMARPSIVDSRRPQNTVAAMAPITNPIINPHIIGHSPSSSKQPSPRNETPLPCRSTIRFPWVLSSLSRPGLSSLLSGRYLLTASLISETDLQCFPCSLSQKMIRATSNNGIFKTLQYLP